MALAQIAFHHNVNKQKSVRALLRKGLSGPNFSPKLEAIAYIGLWHKVSKSTGKRSNLKFY